MNPTIRHSTAIHEAGHAVIAYLLGRRINHALLFNDHTGEVAPQCCVCDTCVEYYKNNEPATDRHAKQIQDDFRKDMAIALAGEVAQRVICKDAQINDKELAQDYALARSRSAYIHYRESPHCAWTDSPCTVCESYLESMKEAIQLLIAKTWIKETIEALAEELEKLTDDTRMDEKAIDELLQGRDLRLGSLFDALPMPPQPTWMSDKH